jgi:MFS family permease
LSLLTSVPREAITVAIAALSLINSASIAWPLVIAFGFACGFWESVYYASAMAFADLRIAASMYAILMAFANLGMSIGLFATGSLVDALGYRPTFLLMAGLNLLAIPLLSAIFGRAQRVAPATRRGPGPDEARTWRGLARPVRFLWHCKEIPTCAKRWNFSVATSSSTPRT